MTKNIFIIQLLLIIICVNCKTNIEPNNDNKNVIFCEPKTIEFNINEDSIETEQFPKYSREYSTLELIGINLTSLKYYYPDPDHNFVVDKEFVVVTNDSFEVELKNCSSKYNWFVDVGTIEIDENHEWINPEVALLRTEKVVNSDNTITYRFIFQSLTQGKGYICFIEENQSGEISANESHGLLIGYSINPLNKINLNLDEIKWIYNIEEGTFSTVSLALKGTTNCYRLRGMTYGDGIIMAMEIPIQDDNSFEIEIPVAFSHVEGITLKTCSELLVYGTVGLPKIIPLVNPKSD